MLFKPLFYQPTKHLYKLITDEEYRIWCFLASKLKKNVRFKECFAKAHNWNLFIPDSASFLSIYNEIFVNKIYRFKPKHNQPIMLDLGANIGISVLFFKLFYPNSKVIAFEADPNIFNFLKKNIYENNIKNVQLINKAIYHENTTLRFYCEGGDGGRLADFDDSISTTEVEAIKIDDYLKMSLSIF